MLDLHLCGRTLTTHNGAMHTRRLTMQRSGFTSKVDTTMWRS
jgi:hypothetical protein